jgi:transcriptional regulator with XRE-family HTH domain
MTSISAERLRLAMRNAEVGPAELARRVRSAGGDITPEYITHITAGRRKLKRSPATRQSLANALGVPVDWIEERRSDERVA